MKKRFKNIFQLLKNTFFGFLDDNVMKLAASLAYYTIFAIPPLSILVINITSFFYKDKIVSGEFYSQVQSFLGPESALEIQKAIEKITLSNEFSLATIVSIGVLLFSASAVFAEIQSSINLIWGFKAKPDKSIMYFITNRLLSFLMIGSLGFLLLVSLMASSFIGLLHNQVVELFGERFLIIFNLLNYLITFFFVTLLFSILYKVLPDGKIKWKDVFIGATFTSALFLLGKFLIGLYLSSSAAPSLYGAAGSILIILVWVYYSAIILYFGVEFTKYYTINHGSGMEAGEYSIHVEDEETYEKEAEDSLSS